VELIRPDTWQEALAAKAAHPDAVPLAGGTDLMVELNFGRSRPPRVLDLTRVAELRDWEAEDGQVRIGAGVTYARMIGELGPHVPGLAIAARTVGSPQIRNRGTLGGNLGSASPAGDCHPWLVAADAQIEVASTRGARRTPAREFFIGPKRSTLADDELIAAVHVSSTGGAQQFAKVGTRNAMVIAVCSFALVVDREQRRVGTGIGSAGPTPLRASEAESFLTGWLDESGAWGSPTLLEAAARARFGDLVAAAARPIDDVRGTAAYRRHALGVIASRMLGWVGL
jgi:CO/xanthine dehydrogenase FAD-binding subunit